MLKLWQILIMMLLCAAPAWAQTQVVHNPDITVDRAKIRLGDVFAGLPAGLDEDIATAPQPGRSVTYDYSVLSKLAQRYQLSWQADTFNDKCVITRAAQQISADMVRQAVIAKLREQGVNGDIDVLLDQRALTIALPTNIAPDFKLHDFAFEKGSQRFQAVLQAAVDTPAFQQVNITGRATAVVDVPVLNKALPGGAVVGKADLNWIKLPADRAADYLRAEQGLVGMELRRQMAAQAGVKPQDILPPRVVLRGNLVTMQVEAPGMAITAQGRALQDGAIGDVIRVTNTQSNRVVEARVSGPGLVAVVITRQVAGLP